MDCWQILGLAATDDQRAIKRAYLARLKKSRPEDDPEAFQRVRVAYESALELAAQPEQWRPTDETSDDDFLDFLRELELLDGDTSKAAPVQTESSEPQDSCRSPQSPQPSPSPQPPQSPVVPDWFGTPPRHLYADQTAAERPDVAAHRAAVWELGASGRLAEASDRLRQELDGPVFSHLDRRRALADEWASALTAEDGLPQGLAEAVIIAFGWTPDDEELPASLRERLCRQRDRTLLARIAAGETKHEVIDRLAAQTLLAPRIGFKVWDKSVKEEWHLRMNTALIWLHANAPGALEAVAPKVVRWWCSPRPVESGWWIFLAIGMWSAVSQWTAGMLKPLALSGWAWLGIMPVVIVVSALFGYNLARGLAWLRVQWVVRLYWPWQAWDNRLAARVPRFGDWLVRRDIGPTRDVLPVVALYLTEAVLLGRGEGWGEFWAILFIALLPTALVGLCWRSLLRILAASPGAIYWRDGAHGRAE